MHIKINACIYTCGYVCVCIQGPGEREGKLLCIRNVQVLLIRLSSLFFPRFFPLHPSPFPFLLLRTLWICCRLQYCFLKIRSICLQIGWYGNYFGNNDNRNDHGYNNDNAMAGNFVDFLPGIMFSTYDKSFYNSQCIDGETEATERWTYMPQITQPVNDRAGVQVQSLCSWSLYYSEDLKGGIYPLGSPEQKRAKTFCPCYR